MGTSEYNDSDDIRLKFWALYVRAVSLTYRGLRGHTHPIISATEVSKRYYYQWFNPSWAET